MIDVLHHVERESAQLVSTFKVDFKTSPTSTGKSHTIVKKETDFYTEFALPAFDLQKLQAGPRYPSETKNARDLLLAGIQDASEMLTASHVKLNDVLLLTLETLHNAMGFRFTTVCLPDVQRTRFSAHYQLVTTFHDTRKLFNSLQTKKIMCSNWHCKITPISLSIMSPTNGYKSLLPSWFQREFSDVKSFVILPLLIDRLEIGLIYADRSVLASEGIAADETALIKTLKSQLISALSRRAT